MQIFPPKTAHIFQILHDPEHFQLWLLLDKGHELPIFEQKFQVDERCCGPWLFYVN